MLTKKIHRHEATLISRPEITGPRVPPSPATPPKMPMALARSFGSVNSRATRPKAAGAAMASPMPWTNRLATSMAGLTAAPLARRGHREQQHARR